jgi:pimeloyl-ACP methyl ester carboxylesterase
VVLIPGFLAIGDYWDVARLRERHGEERTFLLTTPGPLSSHHDRACEVFYQLVGGVIDYGEEHSQVHGHARYGRTVRDPLLPSWSAEYPVDLLGHSIGGQTARVLLHLLRTRAFASHPHTSCAWVRSLSALTSPLNGDNVLYALGAIPPAAETLPQRTCRTTVGAGGTCLCSAPPVRRCEMVSCECLQSTAVGAPVAPPLTIRLFSAGWLLTILVHLLCFFDSRLIRARVLDLQLDHWRLSWRDGAGAVSRLLRALAWRESIGQSADNAAQVRQVEMKMGSR